MSHAELLIVAGSETTATLLSGATYLLLKNPKVLARLTQEVRSAFKSEDEICISSAAQLTYLNACIEESFRSYPPVPIGLPRIVPEGGKTFSGQYVPEGVRPNPLHTPSLKDKEKRNRTQGKPVTPPFPPQPKVQKQADEC